MMINDQQNPPIMRQPSAASSTNLTQHHAHPPPHPPPYDAYNEGFAAKRMRKLVQRRAVDYTSTAVKYLQVRMWQRDARDRTVLQPTKAAVADMLPSVAYTDNPSTSFAARFVHASTNKNKCSINRVVWTPSGRRLITGSQSGEFTLWNGQAFNFEMILQAHDKPVRSMVWSHNENWMVTGDDGGSIKYWQNNMNNVKVNQSSHKESVRDLSFSSTDLKFCSCSDDTTVKVWDFARCQEESSLTGHGWDVKCADWHPKKSLLASGGKDNLVKLWDAKSGKELCSFHGHKNIVLSVKWNQNGNWLLTASKDQIIKLYDIRSMKELESFRGHQKDVTALAWHPFHEEYFVSGSYDGSIFHWLVGHDSPQVEIPNAHEGSVWDLAWHPIGYLLCSGSHDHTTKFWCRNRPGDTASDRYTGYNPGYGDQYPNSNRMMSGFPPAAEPPTPGPFASGLSQNQGTIPGIGVAMPISTDDGERRPVIPGIMASGGAPPLPPGPPPSHLVQGQQQNYQQFQPQQQQQQFQPQHQQQFQPQHQQQFQPQQQFQQPQIGQMSLQGGPNFNQMQPPSNFQMLPPQHMQRPPPGPPTQGQPLGMPSTMAPMSMQQNPMGMQGSGNQMMAPMGQGHIMGMNQMQSGPQTTNLPQNIGAFQNSMPNIQGGVQNFMFNRPPQMGQMPQIPGLNNFQPGMMGGGNMGLPPPPQPPLPPGPAPK